MILMIDNYDSFTYNLVQDFRALGADMRVVRNDEITVDEIVAMNPAGIVFSPGPGNPDSAGVTLAAVKAFAGKIPLFGVCLGHQSVAQAFGGKIIHARRIMHGRTSKIHHDGKGLFEGVAQDFDAMRYHSLAVDRASLPDCLEVTAESEDGEIMGLRHRTFDIETVQYHPESISTPEGIKQLRNFIDRVNGHTVRRPVLSDTARRELPARVLAGHDLTEDEAYACFSAIMSGSESVTRVASLLTALHHKGVTAAELTGAARAMREEGVKIDAAGLDPVDIVGTGGDGAGTFNISTASAFVAAGAGVIVAKHGNGAATGRCGAADVLAALGFNLAASPAVVSDCLKRIGICFLFARNLHPAMRFAAPVRKDLPFRTIFNLLGPLTNPAGARRHVIGVCAASLAPVFAETLHSLRSKRACIVSGPDGLDEIGTDGLTFVTTLADGTVKSSLLRAGDRYGTSYPISALKGGDAPENAKILLRVLSGEDRGACRAAVILNAAAAIEVSGDAITPEEAIARAAESIDSGCALEKLNSMKEAMA